MCLAVPGGAEWQKRVRVWDLPTRVFHWSLVALVAAAFVSGFIGGNAMVWHGRIGLAHRRAARLPHRLGLRSVRPTPVSRSSCAVRRPSATTCRGAGADSATIRSAHCRCWACWPCSSGQVVTGLFANDDIAFNGPLYNLVTKSNSSRQADLAAPAQRLADRHPDRPAPRAIAFYVRVKKEDLLRPMLRGWKERANQREESLSGGGIDRLHRRAVHRPGGRLVRDRRLDSRPAAAKLGGAGLLIVDGGKGRGPPEADDAETQHQQSGQQAHCSVPARSRGSGRTHSRPAAGWAACRGRRPASPCRHAEPSPSPAPTTSTL